MPYLILADRTGEVDRRDLREPLVIGRALDCDLCIRDILLSRKHCRIEPFNDRWIVVDLGSKNGTHVGSESITRHVLRDGEVIRIGRSQVCFRAGAFVPARSDQPRSTVRPADPIEALSSTVAGFQVFDMDEDSRVSGFPVPKPRPPEPASFRQDGVHSIVTQIASTSWDLKLSERPPQPRPPQPRPASRRPSPRPRTPILNPTPVMIWKTRALVLLTCAAVLTLTGIVIARSIWQM